MGSQQSGTQTVNQQSDPWSGAQPYITGGYAPTGSTEGEESGLSGARGGLLSSIGGHLNSARTEAGRNVSEGLRGGSGRGGVVGLLPEAESIYRNSVVNPFNADELSAMEAMRSRMGRDYGLINTGADTLAATARGDYLGQQNFMDAYGEDILNNVNSRFARANRTGSGYAAQAAAKGLTQGAAPLYAQERQLQQQAALASPAFQASQYSLLDADINALMQAGRMQQNRPYENLQNYANIVLPSANQGSSSQTSQPIYSNPMQSAMGGAMAGSAFGPWGALIGGGIGLLGA